MYLVNLIVVNLVFWMVLVLFVFEFYIRHWRLGRAMFSNDEFHDII